MNALALTLLSITAVCLLWAAVAFVVRLPAFAYREVVVTAPLTRADGAHLEAVVREELSGTFFTMDLDRARAALAGVPWIRSVALRRQWPRRLELTVEEHQPLARWNESALVNTRGEVFAATTSEELPLFEGPDGRAAEVAARYRAWTQTLRPLAMSLTQLRLSPRGGWRLVASDAAGALMLELGRDEPDARLARFVAAHGRTLGALARARTKVEAVDLRYRNGFAARIPAFREKNAKPAA
ncbi:MAG: cell division protein FtsQ/DivIB [Burkholderiales bacterium]|nr:cell division protein FtsQ/DivIB [Burkholderiales bacterium]